MQQPTKNKHEDHNDKGATARWHDEREAKALGDAMQQHDKTTTNGGQQETEGCEMGGVGRPEAINEGV